MSEKRSDWATQTHVWASDVDPAHLQKARREPPSLVHSVLEILAYANDEAESQGRRGRAVVSLRPGGVRVDDDGRGTDTRFDEAGRAVRKPVMATRDVRFFGVSDAPLLPDGEPRRGMSTVAANVQRLWHENHRANGAWRQEYRWGVPVDELVEVPFRGTTGTCVELEVGESGASELAALSERDVKRLALGFDWLEVTVRRTGSAS